MVRLNLQREEWVELDHMRVRLRPVDHYQLMGLLADAGVEGLADLRAKSGEVRWAARLGAVTRRILLDFAEDWTAEDAETGAPLPIDEASVSALLSQHPETVQLAVVLLERSSRRDAEVAAEKNASAPSLPGSGAGARRTAKPARKPAPPAPRG